MRMQSTSGTSRAGLSLLEVILSLSILGVSMVAVGHLFNLGFRSATDVQLRSEANMIADTTMAEIAAGVIDISAGGGAVEGNPEWQYEVNSEQSEQPGLLSVSLRVSRENDPDNNVSVSLVRFVPDPNFEPAQSSAASDSGSSSSGSSSRSSSRGSSGSSGGGGTSSGGTSSSPSVGGSGTSSGGGTSSSGGGGTSSSSGGSTSSGSGTQ